MAGPLDGYKIIDLSQVVSGPLATMLLADPPTEHDGDAGVGVDEIEYSIVRPLEGVTCAARGVVSSSSRRQQLLSPWPSQAIGPNPTHCTCRPGCRGGSPPYR